MDMQIKTGAISGFPSECLHGKRDRPSSKSKNPRNFLLAKPLLNRKHWRQKILPADSFHVRFAVGLKKCKSMQV